jgi:hypothetical protein
MSTLKNKMKKRVGMVRCIFVIGFVLALGFFSGIPILGKETGDTPPFVDKLSGLLESRGWSTEEIASIIEASKTLNWERAEGADPEVVALALELGKREESGMEPLEQAELALQLALTTMEMKSLGYEERAVARAALNGVRNVLREIIRWREGGKEGNLGELIRNRLRNEVRSACYLQVREQTRERTRERVGGASQSEFSQIPSGLSRGKSGDNRGRP